MPYILPTFAFQCQIYDHDSDGSAPRLTVDCNLQFGRKAQSEAADQEDSFSFAQPMYLLLPAGTDVRDHFNAEDADIVQAPLDSGRWYKVMMVDDVGKRFSNEYRCAILRKRLGPSAEFWPTPIP